MNQGDQIRVMQTLFHAFSLQLPCRRVLYVELIKVLTSPPLSNRGSDRGRERGVGINDPTDNDRIGGDGVDVEGTQSYPDAPAALPLPLLSPQLLCMISQKVHSRLNTFLKPLESSTRNADTESRSSSSGSSSFNTQRHNNSPESCPKTLSTQHCIDTFHTLRGQEFALGEDFSLLISLSHVLSTAMCAADTASDMLNISKVIIGAVQLNVRDTSRYEGSRSIARSASDRGIEGPGSGRVQESFNTADLGPTGSFLLALIHFAGNGFPIQCTTQKDGNSITEEKDSGIELDSRASSSSIASSKCLPGRSLEVNVPLYSTLSLSAVGVGARKEHNEETAVNGKNILTAKQRKEEERQMKIVHYALCYNLLTGLLSTLTQTLLSTKGALRDREVPPVRSEDDDSTRSEYRVSQFSLLFGVYYAVCCTHVALVEYWFDMILHYLICLPLPYSIPLPFPIPISLHFTYLLIYFVPLVLTLS